MMLHLIHGHDLVMPHHMGDISTQPAHHQPLHVCGAVSLTLTTTQCAPTVSLTTAVSSTTTLLNTVIRQSSHLEWISHAVCCTVLYMHCTTATTGPAATSCVCVLNGWWQAPSQPQLCAAAKAGVASDSCHISSCIADVIAVSAGDGALTAASAGTSPS